MNLNNLAAFVSDEITTVGVLLNGVTGKVYDFKCTKELANTLQVGNQVIVDTINGTMLGVVHRIDEENQIELNSSRNYKWCFAKVDVAKLEELKALEAEIVKKLKDKQRAKYKKEVLDALGIDKDLLQLTKA